MNALMIKNRWFEQDSGKIGKLALKGTVIKKSNNSFIRKAYKTKCKSKYEADDLSFLYYNSG